MKLLRFILLILVCCYTGITALAGRHLFQVTRNSKIGFIDSAGHVDIEPQFRAAGEFEEGLAPARINGSYGFIDETGNWVIQPQYDYAEPFSRGLGLVRVLGKPFYIDRNGETIIDCHNYMNATSFQNGFAVVVTPAGRSGMINTRGQLIVDTAWTGIKHIYEGLVIVYRDDNMIINHKVQKEGMAVVDTFGHIVVPIGRVTNISSYKDGFSKIVIRKVVNGKKTDAEGFMDKKGTILFTKPGDKNCGIKGDIHCGRVAVELYKYWIPKQKGPYDYGDRDYEGYLNEKGKLVINDTSYKYVYDFSDNRAFVMTDNEKYSIIDTHGKVIARDICSRFVEPGFRDGIAFVSVHSKYGIIDTNGHFIKKPFFGNIHKCGLVGNYFFFRLPRDQRDSEDANDLWGIANKDGFIVMPPLMKHFDVHGFENGLLKCTIDERLSLVNTQGKIVWQEDTLQQQSLTKLNINYMYRGYFIVDGDDTGKIPMSLGQYPKDTLIVNVHPEMADTFNPLYALFTGIKVYVTNDTKKDVAFNAQDGRLYMNVQALDPKGVWRDIEYLPNSWCGNSYHTLMLPAGHEWQFITPVYEGDFKTKLRIQLKYRKQRNLLSVLEEAHNVTIYSNEYPGSINLGQFWRKVSYTPHDIMDPYDE